MQRVVFVTSPRVFLIEGHDLMIFVATTFYHLVNLNIYLWSYSQIRRIALSVFQTSKEFWVFRFRQGNTCLLVTGAFRSTLFVSEF